MSIQVEELIKVYGDQKAIDRISFQAEPGGVLGFLGPNGAGKSTTMKILAGFIASSSGSVGVAGFNVATEPVEVRKRLGYLPEHNPLYQNMYVKEALAFMARVHKLPRPQERIAEVIEMTGLAPGQHKKIGALSKGYRQRVGLAQAIIHDPEVLILDEPTSGLDPHQLIEVRELIRKLGKEKTVVLSTHIMQEVEALCERVIIINAGRIVKDESISSLLRNANGRTFEEIFIDLTLKA